MRHLSLILLLATLASAMPLRKGASLGYNVWRGRQAKFCFVTLTIGDSMATDSGVLWNVAIRDSLIDGNRIRTGQAVLRVSGGDTVWQTPSCLTAWDPAARKVDSVTWGVDWLARGLSYPLPFGALGIACISAGSTDMMPADTVRKLYMYNLKAGTRQWKLSDNPFMQKTASLPDVDIRRDTGMVRLEEKVLDERWNLVAMDGRDLGAAFAWPPPDTTPLGSLMVDLVPGRTWAWRYVEARSGGEARTRRSVESFGRLSITVLSSATTMLADSGLRATCVLQARTEDSTHELPSGIFQEGWSTSSTTDTVAVALYARFGKVSVSGSDRRLQLFASGLLGLNSDLPDGIGRFRRTVRDSTLDMLFGKDVVASSSSAFSLRTDFGAVAISYASMTKSEPGEMVQSSYSANGVMDLLSMDSIGIAEGEIDPYPWPGLSAARRAGGTRKAIASIPDLDQALTSHPAATVRLTSVSGRSEVHAGSDALRVLRSRHGIVLLELRDGDVSIPGRILVP